MECIAAAPLSNVHRHRFLQKHSQLRSNPFHLPPVEIDCTVAPPHRSGVNSSATISAPSSPLIRLHPLSHPYRKASSLLPSLSTLDLVTHFRLSLKGEQIAMREGEGTTGLKS
ncbi:uncharacterized protein LOC109002692 [Juglans regia]|nr:uncharacterized protein LOC109002692 [Juglans regia]